MEEDGIQLPIVAVNLITSNLPVSSTEIDLIHEETSKDPTLTLLKHYIHMGWPNECRILPQELHTFSNYREDLSMENGLITKGARLLIPSTLQRKVMEQIHDGHLGIEKCMLKARESVFWPGISNDICEAVEKCGICQVSSKAAKPVGNASDVPPHVWHSLGTDLFYWNKVDYLVVGDYFSKYLIIRKLPNSSTHAVIKELGLIFTEFGRPFILRPDNGPCYASSEFHNFLSENMETSKICQELLRRQPSTSRGSIMELEPGQPVFVKEVHGNVWKTGTIDQPASEPDSYWIRFPDSSILRRTRSMIKPRPLPSHFELQAEAQP